MQIEVTTLLGIGGSVLGAAVAIYMAILRYAMATKESAIERRFVDLERATGDHYRLCSVELRKLDERLTTEEKMTIRQDGEIKLVQSNHRDLAGDLEEIKRNMITKAEFEPRMSGLERSLNQILTELRSRHSSSTMQAVTPQTPKPPR